MKIISNEITAVIKYGRIKIKTRVGELEYSYQLGGLDIDNRNYQLESVLSNYHELTPKELDEIDNLITGAICGI